MRQTETLNMKEHNLMNTNQLFMNSELIPEKEVTLVNLSLILEQACLAHILEKEDRIYLNEDGIFPFWIRIFESAHILAFSTYIKAPEGKTEEELLKFCNKVNQDFLVPSAYVRDDRIWCFFPLYIKDHLQKSHLLRLIRYFGDGCSKVKSELRLM